MTEKEYKAALKKIREGLATKVRILAPDEPCPVCKALEGAYEFDETPALPPEGCSGVPDCRLMYAPILDQYGP